VEVTSHVVQGRIDEHGRVLLPVILIASDGVEIEVEAHVSIEYDGALAVNDELARSMGWRCLGARRVVVGTHTVLMDHYIGTVALGREPESVVVLGGINKTALVGTHLMSRRKLTLDFLKGQVVFE